MSLLEQLGEARAAAAAAERQKRQELTREYGEILSRGVAGECRPADGQRLLVLMGHLGVDDRALRIDFEVRERVARIAAIMPEAKSLDTEYRAEIEQKRAAHARSGASHPFYTPPTRKGDALLTLVRSVGYNSCTIEHIEDDIAGMKRGNRRAFGEID